jgi:DNA invertase Pin-like site-specific DNA recombinase
MRCAIYARYSSDLQTDRSIADQLLICRERAAREGWEIVETFADSAISGATMHRPAIQRLMAAAETGAFDVVLCEALDRLSRDLADTAEIHKLLTFYQVRLVTLEDGEVTPLYVGFKGTMNAQFLTALADKIRRGGRGNVSRGVSAGGLTYGYEIIREFGADGEPVRGKRRIREDQAEIVRRIFAEFVAGLSAWEIVRRLNAEGIPSARGAKWAVSAINGSRARRGGILHNEIYIGRLTYNRQRMIKDPRTGRRVTRLNPQSTWQVVDVPHLAIVDRPTWDAAHARIDRAGGSRPEQSNRPRRMFSGLLKCPHCGLNYVLKDRDRVVCSGFYYRGNCENHRTFKIEQLETRVLDRLQILFDSQEAVSKFAKVYHDERRRLRQEQVADQAKTARDLAAARSQLDRIVWMIENGHGDLVDLGQRHKAAAARLRDLQAIAAAADGDQVIELNPRAPQIYALKVQELRTALGAADELTRRSATEILRGIIVGLHVHPGPPGEGFRIEIEGRLGDILRLMTGQQPTRRAAARSRFVPSVGGRW